METEILQRVLAIVPRPVAIEALWDGDTDGWFVDLYAVVSAGPSYKDTHLQSYSGGGDSRLFNGQVPPWPEAREAAAVGRELADALGIPFYFPSPEHPEDECPHWWQRGEATPCNRCGVPLLQSNDCRWRGTCYHCHLALDHAAREDSPNPEAKGAPRCSICGLPAADAEAQGLCVECGRRYRVFQCTGCGVRVTTLRRDSVETSCSFCDMKRRLSMLDANALHRIREATARGTIEAMTEIRAVLKCGLGDAQTALHVLGLRRGDTGADVPWLRRPTGRCS